MITDLEAILYKADETYLDSQDLARFKSQTFSLEKCLQTYETLRQQETSIFQYVADRLVKDLPDLSESEIKKALEHWLVVVRYCAMAMLADNPEYLQHHILDWLPEQIEIYNLRVLEESLYALLEKRLRKVLNVEQFSLLESFLQQSKAALLSSD